MPDVELSKRGTTHTCMESNTDLDNLGNQMSWKIASTLNGTLS